MKMVSSEKFWLESPAVLFREMRIIPKDSMTLPEQMNALSRLVILFFFVLHLTGYKDALLFLLMSLIFIIILYYLQKRGMNTCENYEPEKQICATAILPKPVTPYQPRQFSPIQLPPSEVAQQNYLAKTHHIYNEFVQQPRTNLINHPSYYNQQVAKAVEVKPDQTYNSSNQRLVGPANPKTMMKPIVAPPAYEWTCWKDNDFILPSQINTRSIQDYYSSGYYVDQPPVEINNDMRKMASHASHASRARASQPAASSDEFNNPFGPAPTRSLPNFAEPKRRGRPSSVVENYEPEVKPMDHANYYFRSDQRGSGVSDPCAKDSCSYDYDGITPMDKDNGDFLKLSRRREPAKFSGDLDDSLGYDPSNLDYNWPSNYPAANCQRTPAMKGLNKQMFTSTVVPGVYYNSQIIEPISSNIGISFDQQIPARQVSKDEYGNIIYEARDPRLYEPVPEKKPENNVPSAYDVYDPRFDGYGTQDRTYLDKMTGQPRFYYDDVDAIRRPNYVTRSNIDFLCNADTYGPIQGSDAEKTMNERIRLTADQSYTDNTLDFRTDMMTRLMRKRNAELWQNRLAPKTTMKK